MGDETSSHWWLQWLSLAWMPKGVAFLPQVGTLVHEGRNKIVREALEIKDWKILVMLDADVFPPPHGECDVDALEMIREYETKDLSVVGPLCYGRSIAYPAPVAGEFVDATSYRRLTPKQHDQMEATPDLYPMDMLGLGMVCFNRRVFESLEPPWFSHPVVEDKVLGEDHQLYRRLKQAKIPVLLDTRWHALHRGSIYYGKWTYEIWRDQNALNEGGVS